jgi:Na+/melibiose symporter-like transporter
MLSGQIADGITTPLVGFFSDKIKTPCGNRTPWYIFGTIIVLPSFLGIFIDPNFSSDSARFIYYCTLPALFNVGWACVQISNMSVVNSLTFSTQKRDKLISLRNGFTYLANFTVLITALILFATIKKPEVQFLTLSIIIVVGGATSSLFYMFALKEVSLSKKAKELDNEYKNRGKTTAEI